MTAEGSWPCDVEKWLTECHSDELKYFCDAESAWENDTCVVREISEGAPEGKDVSSKFGEITSFDVIDGFATVIPATESENDKWLIRTFNDHELWWTLSEVDCERISLPLDDEGDVATELIASSDWMIVELEETTDGEKLGYQEGYFVGLAEGRLEGTAVGAEDGEAVQ